jgi:hypothetical protein
LKKLGSALAGAAVWQEDFLFVFSALGPRYISAQAHDLSYDVHVLPYD